MCTQCKSIERNGITFPSNESPDGSRKRRQVAAAAAAGNPVDFSGATSPQQQQPAVSFASGSAGSGQPVVAHAGGVLGLGGGAAVPKIKHRRTE